MKIMSLARLAEEAAYAAQDKRNLSGSIENAGKFKENFAVLDFNHHGIYAFLAYHPLADRPVLEYVLGESLGDDAGPNILALFLSPEWVSAPRKVQPTDAEFGIKLNAEQHPAYELARDFYPKDSTPRLPGLIFFSSLSQPQDAIYVVLEGVDSVSIQRNCREAFAAASKSLVSSPTAGGKERWTLDAERLAATLSGIPMQYQRSGGATLRGATLIVGVWVEKNAKAIVMAVPKIVEWVVKLKTGGA